MTICPNCSRTFDSDRCPYCTSPSQLVLNDSPVPETGPWWARSTDYVGWKYRIGFFLFVCFAVVWTAKRLGTVLSISLGVLALGVTALVIWLRYRDDNL